MSDSYTGHARERSNGPGAALAAASVVVVIALVVAGLVYYSGSSARIAGDYTAVAAPADQALGPEVNGYTRDQRDDLAAARSDLKKEAKTEASFDDQLAEVTFPGVADTEADALIRADKKRIKLVGLQAQAASLRQLRSFASAEQATTAAVETQVGRIRLALGLPPASAGQY